MRSIEDAEDDALDHAAELVDALQDADASDPLIFRAEVLQTKVSREVNDE